MRALASFVMRGRSQAVMLAVVLAMISLVLPPVSILSSAVVALVTLRHGQVEGLVVAGLAGVASALLALLLFSSAKLAIGFVLLLWLPVFFASMVLRVTRSLPLMVESSLAIGLLIIGVFYLQVPDPAAMWQQMLEPFSQDLVEAEFLDETQREIFVEVLASRMTGLLVAGLFLQLVMAVFLARWWQAVLYNPGGFRQEFHALRLHRLVGLVGLFFLVLVFAGQLGEGGLVLDIVVLLSAAFLLQGLAVIHGMSGRKKAHPGWLVALYVLWVLAMPQITMLLAMLGFLDLWIDFRARWKAPGNKMND